MRPTKHLRPSPANRDRAVELITWGLGKARGTFEGSVAAALEYCETQLAGADEGGMFLGVRSGDLFFNRMNIAVPRLLKKDPEAPALLKSAFSEGAWGCEIYLHRRRKAKVEAYVPLADASTLLALHALSLAGGGEALAAQIAALFRAHLSSDPDPDPWLDERDLVAFYRVLFESQLSKRWVVDDDLRAELGDFAPLIASVDDAEKFREALVEYADFRLSRSYEFHDARAKKTRSADDPMFMFEQEWLAIFPFELVALREIRRACTGKVLSLDAPHPFLENCWRDVPALWPPATDGFSEMLRRFGEKTFGGDWRPFSFQL